MKQRIDAKSPLIFGLALSILAIAGCGQTPQQTAAPAERAWVVPEKVLPSPAAASQVLQDAIFGDPVPDIGWQIGRDPKTEVEFDAFVKSENSRVAGLIRTHGPSLGASIEEDKIAGVVVRRVMPTTTVAPEFEDNVFLHLHPGGYILNGGLASAGEGVLIAARLRIPVISVDYRMPPVAPFPAAVEDVVAVYKELRKTYPAKKIILGGSSAGGGLTLASTMKLKELGLELPAALFAGSPWSDLTKRLDSNYTMEGIDRLIITYDGPLESGGKMYAGEYDLTHPLISPLYGDFDGFPPTQLVTGTRDLFLSHTSLTHRKLRQAGVEAELHVYEGLSHVEYLRVFQAPESLEVYKELREFVQRHIN